MEFPERDEGVEKAQMSVVGECVGRDGACNKDAPVEERLALRTCQQRVEGGIPGMAVVESNVADGRVGEVTVAGEKDVVGAVAIFEEGLEIEAVGAFISVIESIGGRKAEGANRAQVVGGIVYREDAGSVFHTAFNTVGGGGIGGDTVIGRSGCMGKSGVGGYGIEIVFEVEGSMSSEEVAAGEVHALVVIGEVVETALFEANGFYESVHGEEFFEGG